MIVGWMVFSCRFLLEPEHLRGDWVIQSAFLSKPPTCYKNYLTKPDGLSRSVGRYLSLRR
jgi:hypothetical protein